MNLPSFECYTTFIGFAYIIYFFSLAMLVDRIVAITIDYIHTRHTPYTILMHYIQFSIVHVGNKLITLLIIIRLWIYFSFFEVTIICKTIQKLTHIPGILNVFRYYVKRKC